MNKNRIEGAADRGERAMSREAPVIKGKRRRSGGRAAKECVLTWGDPCLTPERATVSSRSEEGRSSRRYGKEPHLWRRTERGGVFGTMPMWGAPRQMPAQAGRLEEGRGEAAWASGSDETLRPRHARQSTGSALLQAALTRENLQRALQRVRANKGAAGVDGLDIDQTADRIATRVGVKFTYRSSSADKPELVAAMALNSRLAA